MKKLIINADDLGADEARNAGIFEAIEAGIVTSASLLANGPALDGALLRIRSLGYRGVSLGIHLNLSEGKPLSPNLGILTGEDGCFLKKAHAHELLLRTGDSELEREIAQEMAAQIEFLLNAGIGIDHFDGHQHVHVFPAAFPAAVRMFSKYRIPWMRIPQEPSLLTETDAVPDGLMKEARFFNRIAEWARSRFKEIEIPTPNHFRGLYLKGRLSLPVLLSLLRQLQPGLTELMVHPGRPSDPASGPFSAFSTMDRQEELETLLDRSLRETLKNLEISLTPFPEEME
jgi:chitin disaccharide deacetylase